MPIGILGKFMQNSLEWDKLKTIFDKPSYSQFNPVWIFPPFLNEDSKHTHVKSSRIYTGQCTFPILLLNDDNMLG